MKVQTLLSLVAVASLVVSAAAVNPTSSITGTVVAVTSATITVQDASQTLEIKRAASTTISGEAKVGATVTVTYSQIDAQKKEGPS